MRSGRRIAVLGDMLELGADGSGAASRSLGEASQAESIDLVYCCRSADAQFVGRCFPPASGRGWHEDPATLEAAGDRGPARAGDVVMVKGSKKMFWVNKFVPKLIAALQAKA